MAVYQFSALSDGQSISFDPGTDVLNFDDSAIAAAGVAALVAGSDLRLGVEGKGVLLLGVSPSELTTSNVTFADGSVLLFGSDGGNRLFGGAKSDQIAGFGGSDTVGGGDGDDRVSGGNGADAVSGNGGADWVDGGAGNDTLSGGGGRDHFVLASAGATNADLLSDFATGWDDVRLDAAAFANIGAVGRFAAGDGRFYAGAGATAGHDVDDRIIFNTTAGQLFYDADGSGAGEAQLFTTLSSGRSITASDIWVFGTPSDPGGGDVIRGADGADSLAGTAGDDSMEGLAGDDTLDGGAGADTMHGGPHNDIFFVDNPGDVVVELEGGGGFDEVRSTVDYTLPAWVNNLTLEPPLTSFPDGTWEFIRIRGTGNELDNVITGSTFAEHTNHLDGADGNDTLIGGAGGDTFRFEAGSGNYGIDQIDGRGEAAEAGEDGITFYAANGQSYARSAVVIDFMSGTVTGGGVAGAGSATFVDIEWAMGSAFGDRLIANDDGMQHTDPGGGYFGGPILSGGGGNDTLIGGAAGDDLWGDAVFGFDEPTDYGSDEIRGGGGDDSISGGSGSDQLFGDGGSDWFGMGSGGGQVGHDTVDGGDGSDTVYGYRWSSLVADLEAGTVTGGDINGSGTTTLLSIENFIGTQFADRITGSAFGNRLDGGDGSDSINGGAGNDEIDGNQGDDTIDGGPGNDILYGNRFFFADTEVDQFVFTAAPGQANADLIRDFVSESDKILLDGQVHADPGASGNFATGDARFFAGAGANSGQDASDRVVYDTTTGELWYDADGSGGQAAQLIAALEGAPALAATDIEVINGEGGDGGDGGGGSDKPMRLTGTSGSDTLTGAGGNDTLSGGSGDDTVVGEGGNDLVSGNGGRDWVEGGTGNDTVSGGGDRDHFVLTAAGAANADLLTDFASGWDDIQLDAAAFGATGAAGQFAAGDGRFYAAAGARSGHDADDRIVFDTSTGRLFYDADGSGAGGAELIATLGRGRSVTASDFWVFGTPGEPGGGGDSVIRGTEGPDSLAGTAGDDSMEGLGGDDTLDGGAGADTMLGGLQNDVYFVNDAGDVVVELEGGGSFDEVRSSIDYTLASWVNNLVLAGSADIDGTGNELDNVITGNDGDNVLTGGGGLDTLIGGLGDDTYFSDGVAGSFAVGDEIVDSGGIDTLVILDVGGQAPAGIENLILQSPTPGLETSFGATGNDLDNLIRNESRHDFFIDGGDGNDTLIGGAQFEAFEFRAGSGDYGNDVVDGGGGGDWLFLGEHGGVVVDFRTGSVTGGSTDGSGSVSFTNIETALGGDFDDHMTAGDTGVRLIGAGGGDTLIGGAGDDVFDGDGAFELGQSVGDDSISGGAGNDTIEGGDGDDTLDGGAGDDLFSIETFDLDSTGFYGNDRIDGGEGSDTLRINANSEVLIDLAAGSMTGGGNGGSGSATLVNVEHVDLGGGVNHRIVGDTAANRLESGAGNGVLQGGAGHDTLTGGAGEDHFVFNVAPGAVDADLVTDFDPDIDRLLLDDEVFSAIGAAGDFAAGDGRFRAGDGLSAGQDADDRIVYDTSTGALYYDADGSASGEAQPFATLGNQAALSASDISVV